MNIPERLRKLLLQPLQAAGASRRVQALLSVIPEDKTTRKIAFVAVVIGILYLILLPNLLFERSNERDLRAARARNAEMVQLSSEYAALRRQVDAVERRGSLSQVAGVIQVMDEIVSGLGLKPKLKGIKGLGSREIKGEMTEEGAEVTFEKLSMNELVNLLYRIDTAPLMLSSNTMTIRRSFENPNAVDLSLTVALFSKKPSR